MFPAPTPEQTLNRVIHHELGHWLMTRHFGFKAGEIGVSWFSPTDIRGTSHIEPFPTTRLTTATDIEQHIFKRIVVLCAGVAVEMELKSKDIKRSLVEREASYVYEHGVMDATGLNDKAKVEELLYILCGMRYEPTNDDSLRSDQAHEIFTEAFDKAREIFEGMLEKLYEMAALMRKRYSHSSKYKFSEHTLCEIEIKATAILEERKSLAVS